MPDDSFERACFDRGHQVVAGIDEAGRGPLAGPVSAAAVVLPKGFTFEGLDDSKKLTEKRRELLFDQLMEESEVRWGLAMIEAPEVDELNVLKATHIAMARAVEALGLDVDHCLVDGLPVPHFPYSHEGIVKGDSKSISIAAASIIAKVSRDRKMREHAEEFPEYGFERHKGYGTKDHLTALEAHGPCRIHRRSFQPVAQRLLPFDQPEG